VNKGKRGARLSTAPTRLMSQRVPTTMGACPPDRLPKTSLIVTDTWLSRSARMPNSTTVPGPTTPTP
jgi:hypothetical protein